MDVGRKGLLKLMLKVPALRDHLQALSRNDPDLFSLCGAFEEASAMLDRLAGAKNPDQDRIKEYRDVCREIEAEITAICFEKSQNSGEL